MQIVEVSDDESDEEDDKLTAVGGRNKASPKSTALAGGWRRMEIVEASDDESDDNSGSTSSRQCVGTGTSTSSTSPPRPDTHDPFPDIQVECSHQGIEAAKEKANGFFAQGSHRESVRWFSKALWVVESKLVSGVPENLHSVLLSNRAFAHLKLQMWSEAEQDSASALLINRGNTKAKYRRALARFELGKLDGAAQDVEEVLRELPGQGNREALDLQQRIQERLAHAGRAEPSSAAPVSSSAPAETATATATATAGAGAPNGGGWRRMEIVEESDDEEEEEGSAKRVFRSVPIVEVADEAEAGIAPQAAAGAKAAAAAAAAAPRQAGGTASPSAAGASATGAGVAAGVGSKANGSAAAAAAALATVEPLPHIQPERTRQGLEQAKNRGNALFSQGKLEESEEWFAKALWLIRSSLVTEVPSDLRSVLHSNRALVLLRLRRWEEAEEDCSQALSLHPQNTKAIYRRATARFELGKSQEALEDVLQVPGGKEAQELKEQIMRSLESRESQRSQSVSDAPSPVKPKAEPFPQIEVARSVEGLEAAKNHANGLFSKGALEESTEWFSKAIWLAESGAIQEVPSRLLSVLHSNRAFAYLRQKRWAEAAEDCDAALAQDAQNTKAKYRRAVAHFEEGTPEAAASALKDVEEVLSEMPEQGRGDAEDLRRRIVASLGATSSGSALGETRAPAEHAKSEELEAPPPGFKRLQIVEVEDEEEEEGGEVEVRQNEAAAPTVAPPQSTDSSNDAFPDIAVEATLQGLESAKLRGNKLFSEGSPKEAVRWFSKAIQLVRAGRVKDVPADLLSTLHSNRALAHLRLAKWQEAEEDSSSALEKNSGNTKARYRRAMASFELGRLESALRDAEEVLRQLPDPQANKEAAALRARIVAAQAAAQAALPTSTTRAVEEERGVSAPPAQEAVMPKTPPPGASATSGFKRLEIVEAEDSDSDAGEAEAEAALGTVEVHPEIKVECTKEGIEAVKNLANRLFSEGALAESVKHFSKALWLAESGRVPEVSDALRSILHSNRAFAYLKLAKWQEAEEDSSAALALNKKNAKARYRLAVACCELGKKDVALQAIDQVLQEIPAGSNKEAIDLKERLLKTLEAEQTQPKSPAATAGQPNGATIQGSYREAAAEDTTSSSSGFKRLQIVEVDDDDADTDGIATTQTDTGAQVQSGEPCSPSVARQGAGRSQALKEETQPDPSAEEEATAAGKQASAEAVPPPKEGFTRMKVQVVDEESSEEDASEDMDIHIDCTSKGIEAAKNEANGLFSKGKVDEAIRWFSKAIRLAQSGLVEGMPQELHSVLYSNRAAAHLKLSKWKEAELDCMDALRLNSGNTKARYRCATARFHLQKLEPALADVEEVLQALPDPNSNREAVHLRDQITQELRAKQVTAAAAPETEPQLQPQAKQQKQIPQQTAAMASPAAATAAAAAAAEEAAAAAAAAAAADTSKRPAERSAPGGEGFADIVVQPSLEGIEEAKRQANSLFARGSFEESVRWFSKALWLVQTGQVEIPRELHAVLYANRAFAQVRLERWSQAEEDSTAALALNPSNAKARYRRALACLEQEKLEQAAEDVEEVLRVLPDPSSNKEARELQQRISEAKESLKRKGKGGWRTLEIEEASSDESDGLSADAPSPSASGEEEPFPEIVVDHSLDGVQKAKEQGNLLFAHGHMETSVQWFSKAIWLAKTGRVELPTDVHSVLFSNRAFAHIKLEQWAEAEDDCSVALRLNPLNRKARYRQALAQVELGRLDSALQNVDMVLKEVGEAAARREASELRKRICGAMGRSGLEAPGPASPGAEAEAEGGVPVRTPASPKSPSGTATAATASPAPGKTERAAAVGASLRKSAEPPPSDAPASEKAPGPTIEVAGEPKATSSPVSSPKPKASKVPLAPLTTPSLPIACPKNAFELLRHFNSMRKHPDLLARYVRERVPAELLYTLFRKTPMEPDDLATFLGALRKNAQDPASEFGPDRVAEYLQQVLRTCNAETQFAMLSASEKQVLQELLGGLPSQSPVRSRLEKSLATLLG